MGRRSGWNKILCCARGLKTLALTRNVALEIVGGGGGSVWVVFPWKMFTTLSSASSTDGIFVPPRSELLRSMTAAYPSSSHFKLSLVLSLPLIFT